MWILLLLLLAARTAMAQPAPVRVVDARCAQCHRAIYESYLHTPMANASGAAAERLQPGSFHPRSSSVVYDVAATGAGPSLQWRNLQDPGAGGAWKLDYYLGSGHLGTTWLYWVDRYLFESPVAWYAATERLDMKPGLEDAKTQPPSLPMGSGCMRCHMSGVEASDAGTLNRYSGLPFHAGGITCESCHGDTDQHVRTGGRAAVVNPSSLQPELRDSVCISCHLEGDISVERAGHRALDYRPGRRISDYLSYYVYARKDPTVRGVSEIEQLAQSTCKRMSGDRMSCTSCHDPHYTPPAKERAAFFRARCLACHKDQGFARSHHPENPDCTSCHMPHNGAQNIPHVAWTDHRILRNAERGPAAAAGTLNELTPIFSPQANRRDQAMAYYLLFMRGNRALEPEAWSLLASEEQQIAGDPEALDALGVLSAERGDYARAEQSFRRVLALDGKDLTALSNLGVLLGRQGKLREAAALLQRAFDDNQDVAGLAMNLARVDCAMGDGKAARETLRSTLNYNPGVSEIRDFLANGSGCSEQGQKAGAR